MPFTLSHPIAIAPIWFISQHRLTSKHRLDLAALSIGAMVPDLDLYIPLVPEGGHTLVGIITIDLPWAILILLVVNWLMTKPFVALLPPYLASCVPQPTLPNAFVGLVSVIIGALSHLIWDDFTHENGWFVIRYSFLKAQIGPWPLYKLLQHGCGVLGLIAIALWIAWALGQAQPQRQPETLPLSYRFWTIASMVIVALIAGVVEIKTSVRPTREITVIRGVVGILTGLGMSFLVYSLCFWLLRPAIKHSSK